MVLPGIPVHTFQWEWAGIGIPFSIGVSHSAPGITRPITTDFIHGTLHILAIGEATFLVMDGVTIQDGVTIHAMDIHPTDMVERRSQKDS